MENLTVDELYDLLNANNLKCEELRKRGLTHLHSKQVKLGRKLLALIEFQESLKKVN